MYADLNNNNAYDSTIDSLLPRRVLTNSVNSWASATNNQGVYLMKLDSGVANTINPPALQDLYVSSVSPASHSITPLSNGPQGTGYNFAVHLTPNVNDLEASAAAGYARPGFAQTMFVTAINRGTTNMSGVTLKVVKPSFVTSASTIPAYTSAIGDTLIWSGISINLFGSKSFSIQWTVPATVSIGTPYTITSILSPIAGDSTPANNVRVIQDTVKGAYDPNEKTVSVDSLPVNKLNTELRYTVHFQNTGTDTAFNIYIKDSLSANLDWSTFRMLGASHSYQVGLREHGLLEVFFPNIRLVDSNRSYALSQGYYQYAVKPKRTLVKGNVIPNRANIFFDYNAAVLTNTARTYITDSLIEQPNPTIVSAPGSALQASIYPNPARKTLNVTINAAAGHLALYNAQGSLLVEQEIGRNTSVDISAIPAGLLIGRIETAQGRSVFKLSKAE